MVPINDFEVYPWDSRQTVIERLAAKVKTLPKYLYLPTGQDWNSFYDQLKEGRSTEVGDLLRDMREAEGVLSIAPILKKVATPEEFLISTELDTVPDVVNPFIAYSTRLEKAPPKERGGLLLVLKNHIKSSYPGSTEKIWNNRDMIKRHITEEIAANEKTVKESQVLVGTKGLPHTDFIRQEVVLHLEFDFQGLTLLEVFDSIKLTPRVPFASVNDLYKILRDFTPNPEWGAMEGSIYLQFRATPPSEAPVFLDAALIVEGETGHEKGILETGPIEYKQGITAEDFLRNLQEIFRPRLPLLVSSCSIVREKGGFYYKLGEEPIDSYVLGDLALNDPLFSQYLAIDEHEAATKKKRSSTYIHFFGSGNDEQTITANITVYKVRAKDPVIRSHGYSIGEYYLKVLVKNVSSRSDLEDFMIIFGKLLTLYYVKAPGIIKMYKELLPDSEVFPPKYKPRKALAKGKKTKATLKEQAPEVFVSGYPTKCGDQPRIISTQEVREAKAAGKVVMQYPKTSTEGFPQRWYVCDEDDGHPYPGLRFNNLSNSNIVPYLPCCFKTPQDLGRKGEQGKQTKPYAHYFYDVPIAGGTGSSRQNILTRDLFTDPPKVAALPNKLEEMLNLVTYRKGWSFVREGVFDSKSSFLECVLEALQSYSGVDPLTKATSTAIREVLKYTSDKTQEAQEAFIKASEDGADRKTQVQTEAALWEAKKTERIALLNELRKGLATHGNAAGCSQEMYDYTDDEIQRTIRDPDVYFDPRFLTNLVEKHFHCKIVLFSRVTPGPQEHEYQGGLDTVLTIPRHVQAYYKTQENVPVVLIYERLGRGSEQKEYPRCELITYWLNNREATTLHDADSRVSREMQVLYERVRESYNLNCLVPQTILPLGELEKLGIRFTHQEIDSYGKCRALMFGYQGETGSLLVTPIQPLLLPRFRGAVTPRLSLGSVRGILTKLKVDPDRETIVEGDVNAYSGRIGNMRFSLPFKPEVKLTEGLPAEKDLIGRDQAGSKLRTYTADKRLARYMVEYARWLYSHFLSKNDEIDSVESLKTFIREQIRVDAKYEYGHVTKTFSMTSGISKDGVLYVKSDETRKRLIYTLQLYALHHPEELKQYKSRTSISNYYLNVGDFTRYRSQVILQGDDAVSKWINERGQDYFLHNEALTSNRMDELTESIKKLSARLDVLEESGQREAEQERIIELREEQRLEYNQLYSAILGSPHFFKNRLVGGDEMYLYQTSIGLPQALRICDAWNKGSVNAARTINKSNEDSIPVEDFTLYSYRSATKITPYVCDDGCRDGESDGVAVLGYRDDENEPTFVSLLPLGPCHP